MTTPTFSLRHPPRRHRAEAVAACFLDACSTVRAVHGAAALPAALAGAVAIGCPLNAATSPCPDLARLMDLASSSCMASRQLRFADGCHHVQAFRCGASHLHVSGLFLVFEPCRSSAPPPAELLREFCAAAAITGEEVAVYDLAGALVGHHPPAPGGPGARPGRPGPPPAPPRLADVLEHLPPAARDSLAKAGACAAALRLRDRQAPVWLRLHRVNSWDRAQAGTVCWIYEMAHPGAGAAPDGTPPAAPPGFALPAVVLRHGPAPDYALLAVTGGCDELLGLPGSLVLGPRPVSMLELVHPRDKRLVREELERSAGRGAPCRVAYLLARDAGDDIPVLQTGRWTLDAQGAPAWCDSLVLAADLLQAMDNAPAYAPPPQPGSRRFPPFGLVGRSGEIGALVARIRKASACAECVLVLGESGSGKELAARAIHEASPRARGPFVSVNCGAIPECLMENEFFGHRKGAFSGADSDHDGLLAQAHGGTLFLDEIGEIPLRIQVKLLRAIEGGGFLPVGGTRPQNPDFRLVAATNRDLEELVASGAMRQDFYYRINVLPVRVPPLRQRRNDIPLLFEFFLEDYPDAPLMSGHMLRRIMEYDWPGNVRELRNAATRYATLGELPPEVMCARGGGLPPAPGDGTLRERMALLERQIIEQELAAHRWNRSRTAEALGVDRRTLYEKIRLHGLGK